MTIHGKRSAVTGTDITQGDTANVVLVSDEFPASDVGEFATIWGQLVCPDSISATNFTVNVYQGDGLGGTLVGSLAVAPGGTVESIPFAFVDTSPVEQYTLGVANSNGGAISQATLLVDQVG
jgi:hypothetical protein